MSKVYMDITLRVLVETDLTSPDEIIDNLDINVSPDSEEVEVYDHEVENFNIIDAK